MNNIEKETYEALKESDKLSGKNEAEQYKEKIRNLKKVNFNYENKEIESVEKYEDKISNTIIVCCSIIIGVVTTYSIFTTYDENYFLIALILTILNFGLLWIYSIISVLLFEFKNPSNKTPWLIGIIFIMPLSYIYLLNKHKL